MPHTSASQLPPGKPRSGAVPVDAKSVKTGRGFRVFGQRQETSQVRCDLVGPVRTEPLHLLFKRSARCERAGFRQIEQPP